MTVIKIVSVDHMRKIETAADATGITFDTMFERVAKATSDRIVDLLLPIPEPRVAILVGSGNNGGDGLVTAVKLHEVGDINVGVYLMKPRPDNDEKLKAVQEAGISIAEADKDPQQRVLKMLVSNAHIVVDAILGIGARLPLDDNLSKLLRSVKHAMKLPSDEHHEGILVETDVAPNQRHPHRPRVVALDCPTGIHADSGEADPNTLTAHETITYIAVKRGMLMAPAAEHVGKLTVATLGIPEHLPELQAEPLTLTTRYSVQKKIPHRSLTGHKGTYGKVTIVAGSINYTGAAGLAAMGAYRVGAGLVQVAAPAPVIATLSSHFLEPTWVMLPHDMGVISEKAADVLLKEVDQSRALLIGPGIGQEDTTRDMLLALFEQTRKQAKPAQPRTIGFAGVRKALEETKAEDKSHVQLPALVLDADALNLLASVENWWEYLPENTIITPHPGEMARLCGIENSDVQANRVELAQEKAKEWNTIILLKGAHTIVATPDGHTTLLPFKTSTLSTAGTGDVLAGVIVGLLAQGLSAFDAAVIGAYIHGSAGVMGGNYTGSPHGVIASDLLHLISDIVGELI